MMILMSIVSELIIIENRNKLRHQNSNQLFHKDSSSALHSSKIVHFEDDLSIEVNKVKKKRKSKTRNKVFGRSPFVRKMIKVSISYENLVLLER